MSRLLSVVVLVLVLLISVNAFEFSNHLDKIPAKDLASLADCPNSCSNQGVCVSGKNGTRCICDNKFLGSDCSVQVNMDAVCYLQNKYCTYWQFASGKFFQRIYATNEGNNGWVGFMFGATDGMAGGQSTVLSVQAAYTALAEEMYSLHKGKPSLLPDQTIDPADVSGLALDRGIDVAYMRSTNPMKLNHSIIPTVPGTITNISMAMSPVYFTFHTGNATFQKIDLALVAEGTKPATNIKLGNGINKKSHSNHENRARRNSATN